MDDGSPVDTNVFTFDSTSKSFSEEFINLRQLKITSDGSLEQQGLYEMAILRSFEDDPDAEIYEGYSRNHFNVTILPSNYTNSPPYLKEDVSGKYIVYENQELVVNYVPFDDNPLDTINTTILQNNCTDQTEED